MVFRPFSNSEQTYLLLILAILVASTIASEIYSLDLDDDEHERGSQWVNHAVEIIKPGCARRQMQRMAMFAAAKGRHNVGFYPITARVVSTTTKTPLVDNPEIRSPLIVDDRRRNECQHVWTNALIFKNPEIMRRARVFLKPFHRPIKNSNVDRRSGTDRDWQLEAIINKEDDLELHFRRTRHNGPHPERNIQPKPSPTTETTSPEKLNRTFKRKAQTQPTYDDFPLLVDYSHKWPQASKGLLTDKLRKARHLRLPPVSNGVYPEESLMTDAESDFKIALKKKFVAQQSKEPGELLEVEGNGDEGIFVKSSNSFKLRRASEPLPPASSNEDGMFSVVLGPAGSSIPALEEELAKLEAKSPQSKAEDPLESLSFIIDPPPVVEPARLPQSDGERLKNGEFMEGTTVFSGSHAETMRPTTSVIEEVSWDRATTPFIMVPSESSTMEPELPPTTSGKTSRHLDQDFSNDLASILAADSPVREIPSDTMSTEKITSFTLATTQPSTTVVYLNENEVEDCDKMFSGGRMTQASPYHTNIQVKKSGEKLTPKDLAAAILNNHGTLEQLQDIVKSLQDGNMRVSALKTPPRESNSEEKAFTNERKRKDEEDIAMLQPKSTSQDPVLHPKKNKLPGKPGITEEFLGTPEELQYLQKKQLMEPVATKITTEATTMSTTQGRRDPETTTHQGYRKVPEGFEAADYPELQQMEENARKVASTTSATRDTFGDYQTESEKTQSTATLNINPIANPTPIYETHDYGDTTEQKSNHGISSGEQMVFDGEAFTTPFPHLGLKASGRVKGGRKNIFRIVRPSSTDPSGMLEITEQPNTTRKKKKLLTKGNAIHDTIFRESEPIPLTGPPFPQTGMEATRQPYQQSLTLSGLSVVDKTPQERLPSPKEQSIKPPAPVEDEQLVLKQILSTVTKGHTTERTYWTRLTTPSLEELKVLRARKKLKVAEAAAARENLRVLEAAAAVRKHQTKKWTTATPPSTKSNINPPKKYFDVQKVQEQDSPVGNNPALSTEQQLARHPQMFQAASKPTIVSTTPQDDTPILPASAIKDWPPGFGGDAAKARVQLERQSRLKPVEPAAVGQMKVILMGTHAPYPPEVYNQHVKATGDEIVEAAVTELESGFDTMRLVDAS